MDTELQESVIPISQIGNRYLVFDVDVVTYLRKAHHICGTTIGTLPQIPQQNLFLGLPVELMKEEVRLLVDKNIAFIVRDAAWHEERFGVTDDRNRKIYLDTLKNQGLQISQMIQAEQRKKSEKALASKGNSEIPIETVLDKGSRRNGENTAVGCIGLHSNTQLRTKSGVKSPDIYAITPTSSYIKPSFDDTTPKPNVPSSYVLYKYLHSLDYYILPGLRFGCDYNVYPGDPLRFHSHFIAVGYEWDQVIPTFDIIGGGRLGTAVKKGFLIGGSEAASDQIRTFTIEWGGM